MAWTDKFEKIKAVLPWNRQEHVVEVDHGANAEPVSEYGLSPPVSLYENDKELLLHADVPGANVDSTRIHVHGKVLQFTAKMVSLPQSRAGTIRRGEYATWQRSFQMPNYADVQRASSSLKQGVLSIRIPKSRTQQTRKIPVKAA